eukprot:863628-Pyramimonas_sp.AAC.1
MRTSTRAPAATKSRGRISAQHIPRVLLFHGRRWGRRARRRRTSSLSVSAARRAGPSLSFANMISST